MIRHLRGRRLESRLLAPLAASLLLVASNAGATSILKLADDSTVVVVGVVDDVRSYRDDAFLVYTITPRTVLKGAVETGAPLKLAQERVFGTERPYFEKGAESLIFATPLPQYSYYRESLPPGSYLQWTDRKETGTTLTALDDPTVVDAVTGYLTARNDVRALARHLAAMLASPTPRLRADALAPLEQRHDLGAALDAPTLAPVATLLADDHVPVAERGAILLGLAHAGAVGVPALAQEVVTARGPLQAAGVDALVTSGHVPPEEQLLAWSRSEDPALRLAAVRGLATLSSRAAEARIAEVVRTDPSSEVRIAAVTALGTSHDPNAVAVLKTALLGDDKGVIVAAGDALGRLRSPEAVRALEDALRNGSFEAEASAAFALKQTGRPEAETILREQRETHPDERVRRVIKLALGEHIEEHEE